MSATTVTVNGVDYALFGGGGGSGNNVDVIGFDVEKNNLGELKKITPKNISSSAALSFSRKNIQSVTIKYNNISYAIFAGGITRDIDSNIIDVL